MGKKIFIGTFIMAINIILGRAIVVAINLAEYYPEKWLAQKMFELSSPFLTRPDDVIWILAGVFALILFILELLFGFIRRIFDGPIPKPDDSKIMSEAAREIYSELGIDNYYTIAAKQIGKTEDGILSYMAQIIGPKTDVYGVPIANNKPRLIPKFHIERRLIFINSGNDLYEKHNKNIIEYSNCSIKKEEVNRLIQELKKL